MKRVLVAAACVFALWAGGAFAGEVKGPPTDGDFNTNETAAPSHANSPCAFSGLNDYDPEDLEGQVESQVQTAADSWKYYELPKGTPGTFGHGSPGLCRGNAGGEE
jgi:hypothetical protein